ncbi:MAG: SDR family oxidoreductase [Alphaproteobacteria bacterium]|nr:SDR family oxidoreductase [Alphaproteobacteria bacterium]
MLRPLAGRAALVTGGASGMGRAAALELARLGADVAIGSRLAGGGLPARAYTYLPAADELEPVRAEIEALGVRGLARPLDVCDDASVGAFHGAAIAAFGKVDILVNAAGICARQEVRGHADELWEGMLETNLTGCYRTIKRALPGMIERRWGRIVNIASTAAHVGFPGHAAYCASKAALLGLTRCVALEGAPHGVVCNAINPGYIETSFSRSGSAIVVRDEGRGRTVDDHRAEIAAVHPQRRKIPPSEVGALIGFLCGDDAPGLTMEAITLAGGSFW